MTDLRTAAQQAITMLKTGMPEYNTDDVLEVLEAALEADDGMYGKALTKAYENGWNAAKAEPVQEPVQPKPLGGWVFKRNTDGTIGITSPLPKPGESRRTSDCVGPQDRDLHELLGKLADHMTALAEPQTCTWQQDGDSDSGFYGTSCRRYFSLDDGTPEDNKMSWCCYCGKKLAQSLITEDEDE